VFWTSVIVSEKSRAGAPDLLRLFVFLKKPFEQDQVFFFIAQERDAHVLGDVIISFGGLDDFFVLLAGGVFGFDHGFDHADNVGGVFAGLFLVAELHALGAGGEAAQLFDALGQLRGVADFGSDVGGERFFDFLSADAVEIGAVGDIVHDRLQLHRVGGLQEF